jgi:phage terminase small subunit
VAGDTKETEKHAKENAAKEAAKMVCSTNPYVLADSMDWMKPQEAAVAAMQALWEKRMKTSPGVWKTATWDNAQKGKLVCENKIPPGSKHEADRVWRCSQRAQPCWLQGAALPSTEGTPRK